MVRAKFPFIKKSISHSEAAKFQLQTVFKCECWVFDQRFVSQEYQRARIKLIYSLFGMPFLHDLIVETFATRFENKTEISLKKLGSIYLVKSFRKVRDVIRNSLFLETGAMGKIVLILHANETQSWINPVLCNSAP